MQEEQPKRSKLKIVLWILAILILIDAGIGAYGYQVFFGQNIRLEKDTVLTIPSDIHDIGQLAESLMYQDIIESTQTFSLAAQQMQYKVKPGKYNIPATTKTNRDLVRVLRGRQLAIKLTFHNFRLKEKLAGYLGQQIQTDSATFANMLNDEAILSKYGYTPETVMTMFIPNTYEVYWDCSAEEFMERMQREHKKFWNEERLKKAEGLELTPTEVYTLASIVECESQHKPERPRIAGVYLNRLKKQGWLLEADPTVIFAIGDFSIKRVLNKHLETDSPYNTYKNAGLPPGPIYMSSISSIDAVLNYEKHNYMFLCAKPPASEGAPQTHAFAKTLNQHLRNAKNYWRWFSKNH